MRQISIKNDRAAGLLEQITRLTGQGKTEAVIQALELYRAKVLADRETQAVIASIKKNVHAHVIPENKGKAPSKTEIEAELGMP
jgi:hypothetical protein